MPIESRPRTTELDGSSVDVLVVDDDVSFAASLVEEIAQFGYVAVAAANGAEALRLAQDRPPRLILLDLEMPVMNGWQFLQRRRSNRALSRIPVVVISGIATAIGGRQRDDVQGIIEKPLAEQELVDTIHALLPEGPRRAGAQDASPSEDAGALVLVVEDDEDTRAAVCEMLQEEGYRVTSARNGQEAEDYLHSGARPDCILLDLSMPVMDGWTFTSRLQPLGGRPIPIVVATAAESYWGYPVPVAQVMRKPLHEETLLALLRKVMPERRNGRDATASQTTAAATPRRH
jgi:CheY-like chemotaxis protein